MPMARASSAARRMELGTRAYIGDFGDSKTVTNEPIEIIKLPSAQPSIKYSGQCSRNASLNDTKISATAQENKNCFIWYIGSKPFRSLQGTGQSISAPSVEVSQDVDALQCQQVNDSAGCSCPVSCMLSSETSPCFGHGPDLVRSANAGADARAPTWSVARSAAAVDVVDLAGHVVGVFEIVDCPHDILDLAVAVERRE